MPMCIQGLAGVNRRRGDGGAQYAHAQDVLSLNVGMSWSAWALALFQIVFIWNFFYSLRFGRRAAANPWQATTLEWSAAPAVVYHGAYEYSVPGKATDFTPQNEPAAP